MYVSKYFRFGVVPDQVFLVARICRGNENYCILYEEEKIILNKMARFSFDFFFIDCDS